MAKLQAGAIDAAVDVPYNQIESLGRVPHLKTVTSAQMGQISIELSQGFAPFRDQNVVQAMNYAIDRDAIVKAVFFGHASPALSPVLRGNYFWTGAYGYSFDVKRAQALMKTSHYPKGFSFTVNTLAGDTIGNGIGVVMQDELKQIGINLKINPLDATTQYAVQQNRKFQASYLYLTADNLDPNSNMLICCVADGGAHAGYTDWKNAQADALFRQTQTTTDPVKRGKLYDRWQKLIMERSPYIWLIDPTNRFAYRDDVHDFSIQPTAHWPLWVVWKG